MMATKQWSSKPKGGVSAHTRARLLQSEESFRLLVGTVLEYAIFMLDSDGRVAAWNAGAERLTGFREEEFLEQHFSRFYPRGL